MRLNSFTTCMLPVMLSILPTAGVAAICPTTGTYADLVALGATGCTLGPGGDKLFNNFTFAGSNGSTTATSPTASQITFITENPGTSTQTGQLVYGFIFNPGLAVVGSAASPNQIQDALLNYDISIVGGTASTNRISSIHLFETAAASGTGVASVTENDIGCTTPTTCSTLIVNVSTISPPGQHQDILGLNLITLHVSKDINVTSGNTVGGFATISGVRDSVDQTSSIPEPASLSCVLFGGGLMVAIALRRRRA